jgi:hypothetical protein
VKLKDPFGRVGRRQQANYASVRQQLQGTILVFAALALLCAGSHYLQTRLLLRRYRRELDPPAASGGMHPQDPTTDGGIPR